MSYICCDCGFVFDEPKVIEENHGLDGGMYEYFGYCPKCGGNYEEAVKCDVCGDEHAEDDLYCGMCADCLSDAVTYDNALKYMTSGAVYGEDVDLIENFMFSQLGFSKYPANQSTYELKRLLIAEYKRRAMTDEFAKREQFSHFTLCNDFMADIKAFLFHSETAKEEFAEWLKEEESK